MSEDLISRLAFVNNNLESRIKFQTMLLSPEVTGLKYFAMPIDNENYIIIDIMYGFCKGGRVYLN
jgi:hypothetical protein